MIFRHLLNMRSHPTWVRGLKHLLSRRFERSKRVAPYVGAWIETQRKQCLLSAVTSHPTWVRGLKLRAACRLCCLRRSHPTWVRGLKLFLSVRLLLILCRTLRGCVD